MKKLISLLVIICSHTTLFGQCSEKVVGLYLTAIDYQNNHISFKTFCKNKKLRIYMNDFLMKNYVTVKDSNHCVRISKDSVYGFIRADSSKYRLKGKKVFRFLISSGKIILYRQMGTKALTGRTDVTPYYYSLNCNEPLIKLSLTNIKALLKDNTSFASEINNTFKYNTDLVKKDITGTNYLLIEILKKYL
jgi:hypothetical protein